MNVISRIFVMPDFLKALKAGEELTNAVTWKNRQALINALVALLVPVAAIARAYGYPIPLSDDQIVQLVGLFVVLVFNVWATFATTARIGLPASGGDSPAAGTDGTGYGEPARTDIQFNHGSPEPDLPVLTEEYFEREALNWQNPKG
jgi:hypothetical protein